MNSALWNGLELLPQRAVWQAESRALFVADVHIGKAATFRAAGLAAPAGTTRENLARLDVLIARWRPRILMVLGDLFHARAAYREAGVTEFAVWRAAHGDLEVRLVAGNHDRSAGPPPPSLGLDVVEEPHVFEGLECRHYPLEAPNPEGPPILAGHLHPATRLAGPGFDRLRLPCFAATDRQLILPAFGEFTGTACPQVNSANFLYVVAGERLVKVPARAPRPLVAPRRSLRPRLV